jgi:RNA polymerase primary sigma factor
MLNDYVNDFKAGTKCYFKDIKKYKSLTKEEEKVLFKKIKEGDIEARNQILEANLKFVVKIAKNYKGFGVPFDELISEGNMGLIRAMNKFDGENNDVKFFSYGKWWIMQSMQDYIKRRNISDNNEISQDEKETKINDLYDENDDYHDDSMAFEDLSISEHELTSEKINIIKNLLSDLSNDENFIIQSYFGMNTENGKPMTLEEIGNILHISSERVRQKKEMILRKIRSHALEKCEANNIYI